MQTTYKSLLFYFEHLYLHHNLIEVQLFIYFQVYMHIVVVFFHNYQAAQYQNQAQLNYEHMQIYYSQLQVLKVFYLTYLKDLLQLLY